MGSLVPGWNEDVGAVPRDLREFDETDEGPKGYFERLKSMRSQRRSPVGSSSPPALLKTQSERVPNLSRASVEHTFTRSSIDYPKVDLGRLSAKQTYGGPSVDWESELDSLRVGRRSSLTRSSVGSPGYHTETAQKQGWWSHLDHAALNTAVEEASQAEREASLKGSFLPQFNVTGSNLN